MSSYGIEPADEGPHRFDPDDPTWNESWFHDWTSADGTEAGHCRLGWMPTLGRVWLWLFLRRGDDWFGLEAPALPASAFAPDTFVLGAPAIRLSRSVTEPLRSSRLLVAATVRGLAGPRQGQVLPVSLDLSLSAIGPPHSTGENDLGAVGGQRLTANRFEQPVRVVGTVAIDGEAVSLDGRGERDHSWGPRDWRMHWTFMVLNGPERQLQAADVALFPGMAFHMGYLQDHQGHREIVRADFDLSWSPEAPMAPVSGRVTLEDTGGGTLSGAIEPLGGTEIDLSHMLQPDWRARYHRTLVRFVPDDGSAPIVGWLERNRFPAGLAAVLGDLP